MLGVHNNDGCGVVSPHRSDAAARSALGNCSSPFSEDFLLERACIGMSVALKLDQAVERSMFAI
jgi:hypothetical protein